MDHSIQPPEEEQRTVSWMDAIVKLSGFPDRSGQNLTAKTRALIGGSSLKPVEGE
jgi:hypothetical protein